MLAVHRALPELPARPEGTSHASQIGQHDAGVVCKQPRRAIVDAPFHANVSAASVGSAQFVLPESSALARQTEPGWGYAFKKRDTEFYW